MLTGNYRFRIQTTGFFKKKGVLVLQCEWRELDFCGRFGSTKLVWRDATFEDLQALRRIEHNANHI